MRLACFVTAHGFGHATRVCAVLEALAARLPRLEVEIFSSAPRWIFSAPPVQVSYHGQVVDFGLVQKDPFLADIEATAERLSGSLPFDETVLDAACQRVADAGCDAVLCDISAFGLAVADRLSVPGILMENFTWDWIYRSYRDRRLERAAEYLQGWFESCRWHVQTEPVCRPADCDLLASPVSREPRQKRSEVRERLGIDDDVYLALISLGGVPLNYPITRDLDHAPPDVHFIVCGGDSDGGRRNVTVLPLTSGHDHSSLIAASDAVVGKAGYSTLAEVYAAGVPFVCFRRPDFPESPVLEAFIETHMPSILVDNNELANGRWLRHIDSLRELAPVVSGERTNGADDVARFLIDRLSHRAQSGEGRSPRP